MSRLVHVLKHRRLDYNKGVRLQRYISEVMNSPDNEAEDFRNVVIITEHEPVYTIGLRTKNYTIEDEVRLKKLGAQFYRTNRGGLITFHGPGQLVAYPVLNLKHFKPSIRWYVEHLEKTVVEVCKEFNLIAKTTPDTGVWIDDRKICSIGVHGSRYITTHGLALNCNTDLTWFDHIIPCGLKGKKVTSLTNEIQAEVDIENVLPIFRECFEKNFACKMIDFDNDEKDAILKKMDIR